MNDTPDFIRQFLQTDTKMDYPFQIACVHAAAPFPQKKSQKMCLWGRGRLYTS